MSKFEAHITMPRDKAEDVEKWAEISGWKFSQIDGDPLMGKQAYCYLTNYDTDGKRLLMANSDTRLESSGAWHSCSSSKDRIDHLRYEDKRRRNQQGVVHEQHRRSSLTR